MFSFGFFIFISFVHLICCPAVSGMMVVGGCRLTVVLIIDDDDSYLLKEMKIRRLLLASARGQVTDHGRRFKKALVVAN